MPCHFSLHLTLRFYNVLKYEKKKKNWPEAISLNEPSFSISKSGSEEVILRISFSMKNISRKKLKVLFI